jgi:hypothetical protein
LDDAVAVRVEGIWSENIHLEKSDFKNADQQIQLGKNVEEKAVELK